MSRRRRILARTVGVAVGAAVGLLLAVAGGPAEAPPTAAGNGSPFRGAPLPLELPRVDFALRDQDGRLVRSADLRGRPFVLVFASPACEESCPLQAQLVRGALDDLGEDLPALAIAVDPRRDTPAAARRFLLDQRLTGRMRFLLGSRAELEPVWRAFAVQPQLARQHHQARIVLADARGRQRVGWFASQATPEALAADLGVLLAEQVDGEHGRAD